MHKTLAEIAALVGGQLVGDPATLITGISGLKEAREGDLSFLANPKYLPQTRSTKASAIIVDREVCVEGRNILRVDNPSQAFAKVISSIKEDLTPKIQGIHPSAVIAQSAKIADGVGIGPHVVIDEDVIIGQGSTICAGSYIGRKSVVGRDVLIYPLVTIREDVTLGDRVIVHSGTVIGSDGFGYIQEGDRHIKVPQMGGVVVGDDVEIGACVTIDRARFDKTIIGCGTKIDNLVQIAHNVRTGENCIIIAQAGVAGSTTLGNNVILAGQSGVAGHLNIGDRAIAGAQAGVTKDIPSGVMVSGYPAQDHREAMRLNAHLQRIPNYVERISKLEEKVEQLQAALEKRT